MTDVNPMTQPLSPIEREARLIAIRNRLGAFLKMIEVEGANMPDVDVRDLDNDTAEVETKWIDELVSYYDQRLVDQKRLVNLDADPDGTDYKLAVNVAMIAANFMATNTPQDQAIAKAASLIKDCYTFIQSTDDSDQPQQG